MIYICAYIKYVYIYIYSTHVCIAVAHCFLSPRWPQQVKLAVHMQPHVRAAPPYYTRVDPRTARNAHAQRPRPPRVHI